MAGILAICNYSSEKGRTLSNLIQSMRLLQHRGKAYWKIVIDNLAIDGNGLLPSVDTLFQKLRNNSRFDLGIGYLSKRKPRFQSMKKTNVVLDGFLVDTDKLHLHPCVEGAGNEDSLSKIFKIFTKLFIEHKNAERACEFLDRHLRGNIMFMDKLSVFAYRDSTGFKPLVKGTDYVNSTSIISSENSLRVSFPFIRFEDVRPGQLLKMNLNYGIETILSLPSTRTMIDPFEFIRESHVSSVVDGKSIYEVRKKIGKEQAEFLSAFDFEVDSAYAEPDYPRPMTLGFCKEYQKYYSRLDFGEGIINDRYDDSDHMIDFSENIAKNKMLTSKRSLKFILKNSVSDKKIAVIEGTIQTGTTTKETIYYLKKANAKSIVIIVSYVPTVDGRQVGLYTHNRDLIAHRYMGKISSMEQLNAHMANDLGADEVYYNSPSVLSKAIGISEYNLWFPEWIRFLDYVVR